MFKIYELVVYCRDITYQLDVQLTDRRQKFTVEAEHLLIKPSPEVACYLLRL